MEGHMSETHSISGTAPEGQPHKHTKYVAGVVIGIIVSSIVGLTVGYQIGVALTSFNYSYSAGHAWLLAPHLLYGNVSIGSLGVPRGIAFDNGHGGIVSSMTSMSGSGHYRYQVYLYWTSQYNVTIYYQDSVSSWQYCAATPRTAAVITDPQPQNFSC